MALPMGTTVFKRLCHHLVANQKKKTVRVRFAPSPTGYLHLGGLRTALFNYLFAKANNGSFVLRIEDTDLTRKVPGAVEKLEKTLSWAGIVPDESPSQGGSYGPYLQSERLSLYHKSIEKLLQSGHCYRCFCTAKRLDLLRKEAARRQEKPRYDNKCRHLTDQELEEKLAANTPYVIRFKYEPVPAPWTDLVYGSRHEDAVGETLEGDFVVLKSDKYPTYHFANVVDDHYMDISHVLRGQEWSISTPKHLQMYAAFSWQPPLYAHLPLIINRDGTKLSKRQGDVSVESYRENHIEAGALLNYLASVNRGFTSSTEGKTLQEMIELFDLGLVNTHSSRLNPDQLPQLNRQHLQRQLQEGGGQRLIDRVRELVQIQLGHRLSSPRVLQDSYIKSVLSWALEHRVCYLEELIERNFEFVWVTPSQDRLSDLKYSFNNSDLLINITMNELNVIESFHEDTLRQKLEEICRNNNITKKDFMRLLRSTLCNVKDGPSVGEMMEVLGRKETLYRLQQTLHALKHMVTVSHEE